MNRIGILVVSIIVIIVIAASSIAFIWRAPKQNIQSQTLSVFVSFYPLSDIVTKVGGQYVVARNLLPMGGEPHDFEPSPRDFVALGKSDLFIYNGAHLEPWVEKWNKGAFVRPTRVVNMTDELKKSGVSLIEKNGATDPHTWVSPAIFMREVEIVRDALVSSDPLHAIDYQSNAQNFLLKLGLLDEQFKKELANCEKKYIVTSHDAFGYLGREYNFLIIPIAGISPDEEPSPKALADIANIARDKGISYIFFETTVSPKLSETIAREVGATVLALNPIESLSQHDVQSGEDYVSTMLMNLNNLKKARICQ